MFFYILSVAYGVSSKYVISKIWIITIDYIDGQIGRYIFSPRQTNLKITDYLLKGIKEQKYITRYSLIQRITN